ncbi:MAG: hypothetical protein IPI69_10695 [Bacteroidales bacterium]|nr:hypothetical protein [Bacteroidales bacterium]MDI9552957.1 hypothetical protein [Bacteroidota bacterium]MBP7037565.1 hypothetical protein [Bacteroidales bacterium]MZP64590.1 hypothetical protein [Bacteroidales bacterium]NLK55313.1 hypothetical protein [Bacteroidales bacterium]
MKPETFFQRFSHRAGRRKRVSARDFLQLIQILREMTSVSLKDASSRKPGRETGQKDSRKVRL